MIKAFLILWSATKELLKILFWLFLVSALTIFTLWFIGQFHPVFDIGVDQFVIKIINLIKTYLGVS
jgi:hypothetical protein